MTVHQKPDEDQYSAGDQSGHTQEFRDKMESYRKKLVWENILAVLVILLNILINYTVIEQIRDYDHEDCSF